MMWTHWLVPSRLAQKLGRGEISNREVFYFILGNTLWGWFLYYAAFTWANAPWTFLSLWEAGLVVVITVFGMIRCFDAAGGDDNSRFAADFSCLTFPVALWTMTLIWAAFWIVTWMYTKVLIHAPVDDGQLSRLISVVSGRMGWFATTAAIVGSQIAYFVWMRRLLSKVAQERGLMGTHA
jgi:hypothetical protein